MGGAFYWKLFENIVNYGEEYIHSGVIVSLVLIYSFCLAAGEVQFNHFNQGTLISLIHLTVRFAIKQLRGWMTVS